MLAPDASIRLATGDPRVEPEGDSAKPEGDRASYAALSVRSATSRTTSAMMRVSSKSLGV